MSTGIEIPEHRLRWWQQLQQRKVEFRQSQREQTVATVESVKPMIREATDIDRSRLDAPQNRETGSPQQMREQVQATMAEQPAPVVPVAQNAPVERAPVVRPVSAPKAPVSQNAPVERAPVVRPVSAPKAPVSQNAPAGQPEPAVSPRMTALRRDIEQRRTEFRRQFEPGEQERQAAQNKEFREAVIKSDRETPQPTPAVAAVAPIGKAVTVAANQPATPEARPVVSTPRQAPEPPVATGKVARSPRQQANATFEVATLQQVSRRTEATIPQRVNRIMEAPIAPNPREVTAATVTQDTFDRPGATAFSEAERIAAQGRLGPEYRGMLYDTRGRKASEVAAEEQAIARGAKVGRMAEPEAQRPIAGVRAPAVGRPTAPQVPQAAEAIAMAPIAAGVAGTGRGVQPMRRGSMVNLNVPEVQGPGGITRQGLPSTVSGGGSPSIAGVPIASDMINLNAPKDQPKIMNMKGTTDLWINGFPVGQLDLNLRSD